ncbi:MAG: pectinesterase family protein [Bacteroides sp.]|nr:pectinesterase family protein [Bacteroides sp.]
MKKIITSLVVFANCLLASAASGPFHAVVAEDGTGDYRTVSEAIAAAPEGRTEPWIIFIKKGDYREHVAIPASKPYIHLVGQDKRNTSIRLKQNVGGKPNGSEKPGKTAYWNYSVHNPEAKDGVKGFAVVVVEAPHFYTEGISYINDWGVEASNGPQALAMRSNADCAAFNDCVFRSFQDTWYTASADSARHYVKDCFIEGAVDYFYGGGDVLAENCTFYNVRSGSVIVAPCHDNAKYGYAFVDCTIDGTPEAADGKLKLGRPWHNNPKAVYINTTTLIPIAEEGWTNMGTIPALFAEYNTHDTNGKPIDLSKRKSTYTYRNRATGEEFSGSCPTTISGEEAAKYTYDNMILNGDGWNPREMMSELAAPRGLAYTDGTLSWEKVNDAAGYVVYDGDEVISITTDTSCYAPEIKTALKVRAVNKYGSQGKLGVL